MYDLEGCLGLQSSFFVIPRDVALSLASIFISLFPVLKMRNMFIYFYRVWLMINAIVLIIVSCNGIWHARLELIPPPHPTPGQNGCLFADDMFKRIFLNENIWISNKISLKYIPWCLTDNIPALVQIMAWRRPGTKPLSEPMLTQFTDAYMRH